MSGFCACPIDWVGCFSAVCPRAERLRKAKREVCEPSSAAHRETFAMKWETWLIAECEFEDALGETLPEGADYTGIGHDPYDNSLEIYGATDTLRLSEATQRFIRGAGFSRVFVNHTDGWETHYNWEAGPFKKRHGWRVKYPHKQTAAQARAPAAEGHGEGAGAAGSEVRANPEPDRP